jgi:predicted amidophosphoribosyltransferase
MKTKTHSESVITTAGRIIDALSERWIGWSFPPPARAMADARWRPDSARDYCGRCGDSVGEGEATPDSCGTCRDGAELSGGLGDGVVRLGPYVDPLRGWIHTLKFRGWDEMAEMLGGLLGDAVRQRQGGSIDPQRTLVVPMPMPWQRRLYRGTDHAATIAHAAARSLGVPVFRVLARSNHPPQVSLPASERKRTGGRGLHVRRRIGWRGWRQGIDAWPLDGLDVVLVDDVRTTGTTLRAGVRQVRMLGPRTVVCAVLAVSDSRARRQRAQSEAHAAQEIEKKIDGKHPRLTTPLGALQSPILLKE